VRFLNNLILLVIAAPTVFASVSNIQIEVAAANVLALARQIETAHRVPDDIVERALDDASKGKVAYSCQDDVSRGVATLRVYLLNHNLTNDGILKVKAELAHQALSAIESRIACSPADGNAWLMRAEVLQRVSPDSPEVALSLARSYQLAKAESWIMGPRFDFALNHFDFVQRNLKTEFSADLRLLAQYAPPDIVASDYVKANGQVREMIFEMIGALPQARRDAVAANSDRLGVTFRAQQACANERSAAGGLGEAFSSMPGQMNDCRH
jgi:hypothetical protein